MQMAVKVLDWEKKVQSFTLIHELQAASATLSTLYESNVPDVSAAKIDLACVSNGTALKCQ